MKIKNIIIVLLGIVFIIGIVFWGASNKNNKKENKNLTQYSAGSLIALENEFDFGKISMKNGDAKHRFKLKNSGNETIKIQKVSTSCGCTTALVIDENENKYGPFGMPGHDLANKTDIEISAGKSVIVEAIFDPAAHGPQGTGRVKRFIYIETNSRLSPIVQLLFEANVTL